MLNKLLEENNKNKKYLKNGLYVDNCDGDLYYKKEIKFWVYTFSWTLRTIYKIRNGNDYEEY